jgi:predicted DNA binding CopG/RHH family protein
MVYRRADMASKQPSRSFTTIKVTREFRSWIKQRAAQEGIPMYKMLEQLLAKTQRGRPWDASAAS